MKIIICLFCFISLNVVCYSQWVQTAGTPEGGGVTDMVVTSNGTIVVSCASFNWPAVQGGIRHSTNSGTTWVNDFQHYTARTLALGQNDYVFASSWNYPTTTEGLYVSTNHGISWQGYRYLVGANNNIFSIIVKDNNQTVYIGTRTGVMKSTNGGYAFSPVNNGIPANSWVRDLAAGPDNIIAAATTNGLFVSTNSAASWVQATGIPANDTVTTLEFVEVNTTGDGIDLRLNAGSNNGNIYESNLATMYLQFIFSVGFSEVAIIDLFGLFLADAYSRFAAARVRHMDNSVEPGVFLTTNNGTNWIAQNEGLPGGPLVSAITGNFPGGNNFNVYLGMFQNTSDGAKIYKRTYPIGIKQISSEVPNSFSLSQNYPNPFNPMTKIKFNISKASNVNITVFDVLGRHITTLVNEKLNAGTYETDWNANSMAGGVYFYRLETEDFSETKKMMLIK